MDPSGWLAEFRKVHQAYVAGRLSEAEKRDYFAAREQLARALVAAQGLAVKEGESARHSFRVRQAYQVELKTALLDVKVVTQDISRGGFSCMVARPPEMNEEASLNLKIGGGGEPIACQARVASVERRPGNARVSFAFSDMRAEDQDRLETALFTAALARMP